MGRVAALQQIAAELQQHEPSFPTGVGVAVKIRDALDDPDCTLDQAARLVGADPMLAARIVAAANSVSFNPYGREVADVKTAIGRIGFSTTRSLVMASVAHQLTRSAHSPLQQQATAQLWSHSTHVAALARVLARQITHLNPDSAFFAGLVHEMGGFYLISRASDLPELLKSDSNAQDDMDAHLANEVEQALSLAVLRFLRVPEEIFQAVEHYWQGYLALPPAGMGDTLLMAEYLAPVQSPMRELGYSANQATVGVANLDMLIDDERLANILEESAEEVQSLSSALR